jgi:hypothetical protein
VTIETSDKKKVILNHVVWKKCGLIVQLMQDNSSNDNIYIDRREVLVKAVDLFLTDPTNIDNYEEDIKTLLQVMETANFMICDDDIIEKLCESAGEKIATMEGITPMEDSKRQELLKLFPWILNPTV